MPEEDFYALERTIELIRSVERDLALNRLDPNAVFDLSDNEQRLRVRALLNDLDILLGQKTRDPRLLRLVIQVKGLRDFIDLLGKALENSAVWQKWLQKQKELNTIQQINQQIDRIVGGLDDWARLADKKVLDHMRGKSRNRYLEDLPQPEEHAFFYVMVKELNPHQTEYKHQFNPKQLAAQQKRTTKELLAPDPVDPIAGYRTFAQGDSATYPGSDIHIVEGHHRTFELYRRYLQGELNGDTLILVKKKDLRIWPWNQGG